MIAKNEQMSQEVQCNFYTTLPSKFKVPEEAQINLATTATA
jgi:hypothetical protein